MYDARVVSRSDSAPRGERMTRLFVRRCIFAALAFLPALLWAEDFGDFSFDPPKTDLSVAYLETIFGVVGNVLSGSGSQNHGQNDGVC